MNANEYLVDITSEKPKDSDEVSQEILDWLDSGKYLPPPLRDFHDQKEVFKTIHRSYVKPDDFELKGVSWRAATIYTIDFFLWWMAKRGYTLQRSKAKLPFRDITKDASRF